MKAKYFCEPMKLKHNITIIAVIIYFKNSDSYLVVKEYP
jgi:hypothetical protein